MPEIRPFEPDPDNAGEGSYSEYDLDYNAVSCRERAFFALNIPLKDLNS